MSISSPSYRPVYTQAQLAAAARMREIEARRTAAAKAHAARKTEERSAADRLKTEQQLARETSERQRAEREAQKLAAIREAAAKVRHELYLARTANPSKSGVISDEIFNASVRDIAAAYEMTPAEVLGQCRTALFVAARTHLSALLCMRAPRSPIAEIGRRMERDHTTVLHHLRTYNGHFGTSIRGVRPRGFVQYKPPFRELAKLGNAPLLEWANKRTEP